MGTQSFSIPGAHGSTITFAISGAVSQAIAQAFAAGLLAAGPKLVVQQANKPAVDYSIDIKKPLPAGKNAKGQAIPTKYFLYVQTFNPDNGKWETHTYPFEITPADAKSAAATAAKIDEVIRKKIGIPTRNFEPGNTKIYIGSGDRLAEPYPGDGAIAPDQEQIKIGGMGKIEPPALPGGKVGELVLSDTAGGSTVFLNLSAHSNYKFVYNQSAANVVFDASAGGSPTVISTGTGSTTFYGGAGGGADVAEYGNNLFLEPTGGGGQYSIQFGNGSNTIWAGSGNDLIQTGTGANIVGLGSGSDTLLSGGSDTIIAGSGRALIFGAPSDADVVFGSAAPLVFGSPAAATVVAGSGAATVFAGSSDLVFGGSGPLLFVGGGAGSSSTVIGGAGNETLFGGAGASNLFFVGTGSFTLDAQSSSDTVVGGPGASSVTVFAENGGSVTLFSTAPGNLLVAGAGNVTLNAAGSSGGNTFWAGTGNDLLIGGTGTDDRYNFARGSSGGADTIGNWTKNDKLDLVGYAATGGYTQTTVNGNATFALSDGTTITVEGVASIPGSHISVS